MKRKVYVLMKWIDIDEGSVEGAFASVEEAAAYASELAGKELSLTPYEVTYPEKGFFGEGYEVKVFEVDFGNRKDRPTRG